MGTQEDARHRRLEDLIVGAMPAASDLWNEWTLRQAIRRAFYFQKHGEYPVESIGPSGTK